MAFRCIKLFRIIRSTNKFSQNFITTSIALPEDIKFIKPKQYRTEDSFTFLEDPDNFGTLSKKVTAHSEEKPDEDDIKEENFLENAPLPAQKLTIKQYADLIKEYVKYKRLKEAIDVLEIRMLKQDRVKPVNYIYNILIGACADVGYTKKAFKLYNDMKRRALKPTGDTYTCLFNACANSPWPSDGLRNAKHLKELMIEKGVEPNLTNYHAMIKAFGWTGDVTTAFKIVDEMMEKGMKIRVHTFNHLLQACITNKDNGLQHALVVWRKMLRMREKPNIYTFNLMLKCVKDCNLGTKSDIEELISTIQNLMPQSAISNRELKFIQSDDYNREDTQTCLESNNNSYPNISNSQLSNDLVVVDKKEKITIQFLDKLENVKTNDRTVPNLLSKVLNMEHVTALQEVHTLQDKFAVIGGQDDFIKEMKVYSVKPNIKTFTQMLPLLDNSTDAENELLLKMKSLEINADIDFYNMLIKKRCLRLDYDSALAVKEIITKESEFRKKRYPHSKKLKLDVNIMTYGILAMTCKTRESAEELLNEMSNRKLKVNIEILGTLLRQGSVSNDFGYVVYIMNVVKKENIPPNYVFIKHLEKFSDKCKVIVKKKKENNVFARAFENFSKYYSSWLKDVNYQDLFKEEHPWQQFRENYPQTIQRDGIVIKEPKKFYKRNRKYVPYIPKVVN